MKHTYQTTETENKRSPLLCLRHIVVALLLACCTLTANANGSGVVSGVVKDSSGAPLVGATIVTSDGTTGVTTDLNGAYTLKVAPTTTLNISYMGYQPQQIAVGEREKIDIVLTEDNTSLEEVVVVGYGVQKRRDIIGAVETLSTEDVKERMGSYQNVSRALQGAVPGLTMTFSDGKPSRGAKIRIRGAENSIGSGGSALVLVDGIETDMTTVNPEDIATITVLKDASSTAVYGARGTFGVILLTTKNAEKGDAKVTYSGTYSIYKRNKEPQIVSNGYDFTTSYLESYRNAMGTDPASINNVFSFSREWYEELGRRNEDPSYGEWNVNNLGKYNYYGNTNWYDVFYKDYTTGQQHNVTVSGGGDKSTYYFSGRAFQQDGIYNAGDEQYQQYNVKAKGSVQVRPWLKMENVTDFMRRSVHQPTSHTGLTTTATNIVRGINHQGYPMTLVTNPDGTWTEAAVYTGWAGFVEGNSWRKDNKFDMNNKTSFTADLIKDVLVGYADLAVYYNNTERRSAVNSYEFYTGPSTSAERPSGSLYEERTYNRQNIMGNATLTYTPKLSEDHSLTALGGWNIEEYNFKSNRMSRDGIVTAGNPNFGLMNGETIKIDDNGSWDSAMMGLFYRLNYGYKGRYLIEASGRYDGNSKFPENERWGFFPSASAGWRISEEEFMQDISWLDNLKLRVSAGTAGNGLISDAYAYQSAMAINVSSVVSNGSLLSYTSGPTPVPETLSWESATTYDLGVDFEAFNGRLTFTGDIYRRNTKDMYVSGPEIPAVFGYSAPSGNYADMKTNGYELSLMWRNSHMVNGKLLSYTVKGAFWDSKSEITRYTSSQGTLPTNYKTNYYVGMQLGEVWGYEMNGLFQTDEEAQTYADYSIFSHNSRGWAAGDPRIVDQNGDGVIDDGAGTISDHGDLVKVGNTTPRYNYSIYMAANWNGIGLSMMWQGVGKRDWYPAKESGLFWGQYGRPYSNALPWHENRWSEDNRDAYWPRLVGYEATSVAGILSTPNTRYMQSAAYLRLKNLTVDYTFPKEKLEKIGIKGLKVYLSGENLLTFTPLDKYAKNYDPENIYAGDSDFKSTAGSDNSGDGDGYPVMKSYTIGVNLTF